MWVFQMPSNVLALPHLPAGSYPPAQCDGVLPDMLVDPEDLPLRSGAWGRRRRGFGRR